MNAYRIEYTWTINKKEYSSCDGFCLADKPNNRVIKVRWSNILDYAFCCPFNILHCRKGIIVSSPYLVNTIRDIKEWKNPDFIAMLKIEYKETTISINDILKYSDGEKAIQYLTERGMNFINK